jgi:hypothetical protein
VRWSSTANGYAASVAAGYNSCTRCRPREGTPSSGLLVFAAITGHWPDQQFIGIRGNASGGPVPPGGTF